MTRKRKLFRILLIGGAALVVLLAFAPSAGIALFGTSIVQSQLEKRLACNAKVTGLRGGWSGLKADSITLSQPPGFEGNKEPLLEARGISAGLGSLFRALTQQYDLLVSVEEANVNVIRGKDGVTNLQRVRKPKDPGESLPPRPGGGGGAESRNWGIDASLKRGRGLLHDSATGSDATIDDIVASAKRTLGEPELEYSFHCTVRAAGGPGSLKIDGGYEFPKAAHRVDLHASNIDLAAFSPILASTGIVATTGGLVNANVKIQTAKSGALAGDGALAITQLYLDGGKLAAPVREPLVSFTPKFTFDPKTMAVSLEGSDLTTSWLRVTGGGSFQRGKGGDADLELSGDLAKAQQSLAAFFPEHARLAGRVDAKAKITSPPGAPSTVVVTADGKNISCATADGAVVPTDGTLRLSATVAPDFTDAKIREGILTFGPAANVVFSGRWRRIPGTPGPGQIDAEAQSTLSLDELSRRFGGFLPEGLALGGSLQVNGRVATSEAQEIEWSGSADGNNIFAGAKSGPPSRPAAAWVRPILANPIRESRLTVRAEGTRDPRFERFEIRNIDIKTSSGALNAEARAEGSWRNLGSSLRANVKIQSDLAKLAPYAAAWLPPRMAITGRLAGRLELEAENGRVRGPLELTLTDLVISGSEREGGGADGELWDRLHDVPARIQQLRIAGGVGMDAQQKLARVPDLRLTTEPRVAEGSGELTFGYGGPKQDTLIAAFDGTLAADRRGMLRWLAALAKGGAAAPEGDCALRVNARYEKSPEGEQSARLEWGFDLVEAAGLASGFAGRAIEAQGKFSGNAALDRDGRTGLMKASVDASIAQFGDGASVLEPEIKLVSKITKYPIEKGTLVEIEKFNIKTTSGKLAANAAGKVGIRAGGPFLQGSADGEADFGWFAGLRLSDAIPTDGKIRWKLAADPAGDATKVHFDANGEGIRAGSDSKIPAVGLAAVLDGTFDWKGNEARIDRARLDADGGSLEADLEKVTIRGIRDSLEHWSLEGDGRVKAPLARVAKWIPALEGKIRDLDGSLSSEFHAKSAGASTAVEGNATIESLHFVGVGKDGSARAPFDESRAALEFGAKLESREWAATKLSFETKDTRIVAKGTGVKVADPGGARELAGDVTITCEGEGLTRAAAPWMPKPTRFEGLSKIDAKLGGSLRSGGGDAALASGNLVIPAISQASWRVEDARGRFRVTRADAEITDFTASYDSLTDGTDRKGTIAVSRASVNLDGERSFFVAFDAKQIPAGRELSVPLSRVFPLFAGDFKFAKFAGALDSKGSLEGNLADLGGTAGGDVATVLTDVELLETEEFGEVLKLLRLKSLQSTYEKITIDTRIAAGRFSIRSIDIDGDPNRLPLSGSVGLDGTLDARVDLSRARLGKSAEPYRPILALFKPGFAGTTAKPQFAIVPPAPERLGQEIAKIAAGTILGGSRVDLSKLSRMRSLRDFNELEPGVDAREASESRSADPKNPKTNDPKSTDPKTNDPNANNTETKHSGDAVPDSAGTGAMPAELNKTFRGFAKGKNKFDYAALGANVDFAARLRRWLKTHDATVKSDDAKLADALNRHEAALALAVAKELENPLFAVLNRKDGVHNVDGFFERPIRIAGETLSLTALANRIRSLGPDAVICSIAGAAEDLPWIDRKGVDAAGVRKNIETRAAEYVSHARWNVQRKAVAVPPYLYRSFKSDEGKIRDFLKRYLPEDHGARAKLDTEKLVKQPESLDLDTP
jgi:hypothetical protein